ncbi:E3 ubiquitin-protein ligase [Physcia stellaris]|nr:E3 ubiquitin-protein ligase [Physcia stellaris]
MADVDMADAAPPASSKTKALSKGAKADAGSDGKKRFEVKKWNAVALWAWDIVVDNCAICRNHIMDLCIECQANQASATNEESRLSFSLHLTLAEDSAGVPPGQSRLGVPKVWAIGLLESLIPYKDGAHRPDLA